MAPGLAPSLPHGFFYYSMNLNFSLASWRHRHPKNLHYYRLALHHVNFYPIFTVCSFSPSLSPSSSPRPASGLRSAIYFTLIFFSFFIWKIWLRIWCDKFSLLSFPPVTKHIDSFTSHYRRANQWLECWPLARLSKTMKM